MVPVGCMILSSGEIADCEHVPPPHTYAIPKILVRRCREYAISHRRPGRGCQFLEHCIFAYASQGH